MIDIHSHILSGLDDGAKTIEDSIAMARIYEASGFRQVIATPHAEVDSLPFENYAMRIRGAVASLNSILNRRGVGVVVSPGMEVGLDPILPHWVEAGKILTLADSRYLLVETSFRRLPLNWWDIVIELGAVGKIVIFAHPERSSQVSDEPEIIWKMIRAGAKIQVNWSSISGANGVRAQRVAGLMARKGWIHCMATDSHDVENRHAGNINGPKELIAGLIGYENLERICEDNPLRIAENRPLLDMGIGNKMSMSTI